MGTPRSLEALLEPCFGFSSPPGRRNGVIFLGPVTLLRTKLLLSQKATPLGELCSVDFQNTLFHGSSFLGLRNRGVAECNRMPAANSLIACLLPLLARRREPSEVIAEAFSATSVIFLYRFAVFRKPLEISPHNMAGDKEPISWQKIYWTPQERKDLEQNAPVVSIKDLIEEKPWFVVRFAESIID
jgi:hypothetical protein